VAFLSLTRSSALAAVALVALARGTPAAGQAGVEADVKAAFLFNFTKFVEWPATAPGGAFEICTLAEPGFDGALARTLEDETTGGRPIVQVTPDAPELASACHILFISRAAGAHADRWLAAVRGLPVLIVAESKAAADAGAHITFVVENNRVKFDVNEDAASRAGLKISSKLLRVARHVTARGGS